MEFLKVVGLKTRFSERREQKNRHFSMLLDMSCTFLDRIYVHQCIFPRALGKNSHTSHMSQTG